MVTTLRAASRVLGLGAEGGWADAAVLAVNARPGRGHHGSLWTAGAVAAVVAGRLETANSSCEMKEVEEAQALNKTCRALPDCSSVWKMHRCVVVFTVYTWHWGLGWSPMKPQVGFRKSAFKAAYCSPTLHLQASNGVRWNTFVGLKSRWLSFVSCKRVTMIHQRAGQHCCQCTVFVKIEWSKSLLRCSKIPRALPPCANGPQPMRVSCTSESKSVTSRLGPPPNLLAWEVSCCSSSLSQLRCRFLRESHRSGRGNGEN